MNISVNDIIGIIDQVGFDANKRKKVLRELYIDRFGEDFNVPIKWYRKRKNADIKDALTLEGIKRGFSVRAEKTMGALPEYCGSEDQEECNRFDLSWENMGDKNYKERTSKKNFVLLVEIEMEADLVEIGRDFKKLVKNKNDCTKVMICQSKTVGEIENIKADIEKAVTSSASKQSVYLLSIWSWEHGGKFLHFQYKP
ncbi:hypothetical protein [Endozoicomonas acroporae]|uniref:hypothetical protein n=1 Tax=Endozoicomonas acroporae TaxID=1701104 RepID=UPI0013D74502|nr:hypothetical protein [Endozoicomonas acroporae]